MKHTPRTLEEVFETLPKSERTLQKRGYQHYQYRLLNDTGKPCVYRVVNMLNQDLGVVQYYGGRLLSCFGYAEHAEGKR